MNERILLVGPTSGIGKAVAHVLAEEGKNLLLAGRDLTAIESIAQDLKIRYGVDVASKSFEALAFETHGQLFEFSSDEECISGLFLCHGYMTDQSATQTDFAQAAQTIDVNYKSCVSVLHLAADYFCRQGKGFICALSSVAGDRGRQSNYTYGSSKAALSVFLQGLRNRLAPAGIPVTTVKPGFVDTAMTWGILDPDSLLVASPQRVARDIVHAVGKKRDVVYVPWFWFYIMLIIKSIPEVLFKRLKL